MHMTECLREYDVMETVACGRWPDHCPDELSAHIAACAGCADVLEVALAFRQDHETAQFHAQIPPAGLVWWRAELRMRQEAMRTASQPMTLVQAFGAAAGIGVAVALFFQAWPWLRAFLAMRDFSALSFVQWSVVIAFAVAVLVLAPLAMYLVLSDE